MYDDEEEEKAEEATEDAVEPAETIEQEVKVSRLKLLHRLSQFRTLSRQSHYKSRILNNSGKADS